MSEVDSNVEGNTEPTYTPIEQKALDMGWRPKEDWNGDEEDFISAETFVARKPLFDKIEYQSKELKDVRKALQELQQHHIRVKEVAFKDAYETLKAQKKEALAEGDADKLIAIDEDIATLRQQEIEQKKQNNISPSQQLHPEFKSWVDRNSWYVDSSKTYLRDFADKVGLDYATANEGAPPEKILKEVERQVKLRYKEEFSNERKDRPSAVEGSSARVNQKDTKDDGFVMSEDDERAMKRFVKLGVMTKEEYIAELKAVQGKGN